MSRDKTADVTMASTFGQTVRNQRERANQSVSTVAKRSGLTVDHLKEIEKGLAAPTLVEIYELAKALDLTASELVRFAEDRNAVLQGERLGHRLQ